METRLTPVESPSFIMKLAYLFSKIKFGKVLSPLKVAYVRLPLAFSLFSNKIGQLELKLQLKRELSFINSSPRSPDQHVQFLYGHWNCQSYKR